AEPSAGGSCPNQGGLVMSRFHRKTAPEVRDGEVQRKNNWRQSPSCFSGSAWGPVIERRRPGPGHRHLLMKRDVERFVELLPHWDDVSHGLDVIVLDCGRRNCDGWYNRGALGICAWPLQMS